MQTNENDTQEEQEILDFNNPAFRFKPNEVHSWRQQGPYLVCKSCDIEHATYIGMERILTGLDGQGRPILKAR